MTMWLNKPRYNISLLFLCGVLATLGIVFGEGKKDSELTFIYMQFFPLIILIATVVLYYISRKVTKKGNWILTVLGSLLLLAIGITMFFGL